MFICLHAQRLHVLLIALLLHVSISLFAQRADQILPVGLSHARYDHIALTQLPPIDSAVMRANERRLTKERYIAYNFKTNFSPQLADFKVYETANNYKTWLLKLKCTGAYGVAMVFANVKLLPGEKLYVYNVNGMRSFDYQTIPPPGVLPTDFFVGDEVVVEFDVPRGAPGMGGFKIETVSHAYHDVVNVATPQATTGQSTRVGSGDRDCYICLDGDTLQQNKRAVVKLTIHMDEGSKLCTGTLVNNTAQDKKPYVITAQHCITNQKEAQRTVFTFNDEELLCSSTLNTSTPSLYGATYMASGYANDFALVLLNDYPSLSVRPYYAGWDIADADHEYALCIHHPQGGPKKISVFQGALTITDFNDNTNRAHNAYWRISEWDQGATEGGSSGSPLFNKNHLVIGTLTGGSSVCGAPFNDYFQRLSQSWQPFTDTNKQLKTWLDPISAGFTTQPGMDPFKGIKAACDTLSNIQPSEIPTLVRYPSGVGYYSGFNTDNIASYAEKFYAPDSVMVTASIFNVGSVNEQSTGGIIIAVHENDQGLPGNVLFETYMPYYRLRTDEPNYIVFNPFIKLTGTFFISYTLSYAPQDSFAVQQSPWRSAFENTAFVKLAQGWVPLTTIAPGLAGASFNIGALICQNYRDTIPETETSFTLYPNPTSAVVVLKFNYMLPEKLSLELYDMHGRLQPTRYYQYDKNFLIDVASLAPGMYIVGMQADGKTYHLKFIKGQ